MLATFMEVLDTTVVNVSIPHIAGNLAATNEEGTWVVTSYLVSNAIVLPISGWLANRLGRKRLLLICVAGFTLTSLCCGLATSLAQLIIFRVLQGLTGGGLQPLAQAILLETFPKETARSRHGRLWHRHPAGAHPRPHARRMDHRQLQLALDLLPQPAGRRALAVPDEPLRLRSALYQARQRAESICGESVFWPSASARCRSCSIPGSAKTGFRPSTSASSPLSACSAWSRSSFAN